MKNRSYIIFILFISLLIVFDAMQQKFYIDTFNLSKDVIPLSELVFAHFVRWVIWLASGVLFGYFVWKQLAKNEISGKRISEVSIIALTLPLLLLVILLISLISMATRGLPITSHGLGESMIFYFYQKGMTFFMAYVGVVLWLFNQAKSMRIDAQWLEIKGLKKEHASAVHEPVKNVLPQITVKIGNRVKSILIQEIRWIQADDYCVRIHTEKQMYCLRKSLKFLEKELAPYRFVRVHRAALLNLDFLDQINFESATITLNDNSEVPLSKSGVQLLRKKIKEQSI